MTEAKLLDKTLEILGEFGAPLAYEYILSNKDSLENCSGQLFNFLYCLAALTGSKEEALKWLKEAVVDKGFWYRPEVFEDSDLDLIRDDAVFEECKKISDAKYHEALRGARTLCTWEKVNGPRLALVLHGNQQNMTFGRDYWQFMQGQGYQVEYVQSKTIDSHMLYRWEDGGEIQLDKVVNGIFWDAYNVRRLCGFSAGCNEILRTLASSNVVCEEIVLLAPWIPVIDGDIDGLMAALGKVRINIICGENDEDCLPHAKKLAEEALKRGLDCKLETVSGLGHSFPA